MLCVIMPKPSIVWLNFLNTFKVMPVYIVIDNNIDYTQEKLKYPTIHFIQIDTNTCMKNGFQRLTMFDQKTPVSGWDKAIFYFSSLFPDTFKSIWFVEDDVFFKDERTLLNINNTYNDQDLLSSPIGINKDGNLRNWHWTRINIKSSPPYYFGMMCAIRGSFSLLKGIAKYADQNKTLYFLEALFPTICKHSNLNHQSIPELESIVYRHIWNCNTINPRNLYHPVKNMNDHTSIRKFIKDNHS